METTVREVAPVTAFDVLTKWMGYGQRSAVKAGLMGEERKYFVETLATIAATIDRMPATYEQEGIADPIVSLHYFVGGSDWYITEKDLDLDGEGQIQAFGFARLGGFGGEMGYISIPEIVRHGGELDFHFTPCPLSTVRGEG